MRMYGCPSPVTRSPKPTNKAKKAVVKGTNKANVAKKSCPRAPTEDELRVQWRRADDELYRALHGAALVVQEQLPLKVEPTKNKRKSKRRYFMDSPNKVFQYMREHTLLSNSVFIYGTILFERVVAFMKKPKNSTKFPRSTYFRYFLVTMFLGAKMVEDHDFTKKQVWRFYKTFGFEGNVQSRYEKYVLEALDFNLFISDEEFHNKAVYYTNL
jgi:hypothetical protein